MKKKKFKANENVFEVKIKNDPIRKTVILTDTEKDFEVYVPLATGFFDDDLKFLPLN